MSLTRIRGDNFRAFERVQIEPQPRLNLFVGPNAAGKTSVLEMVYLLGRGRSFRSAAATDLAGADGRHWGVRGRFEAGETFAAETVRLRWTPGDSSLLSDSKLRLAEIAARYPVQVVEPGQHRLLEDGPVYRRRFLDWGVFHVEHRFLSAWRAYQRALKQRNSALKRGQATTARNFEAELVRHGEQVDNFRRAYLEQLRCVLSAPMRDLLATEDWNLDLHAGWKRGIDFGALLDQQRARDLRVGQTVEGPHRAELRLRLSGSLIRNRVSRGQQKLLVAALVTAQCQLVHAHAGRWPILLIDDFGAELGPDFRRAWAKVVCAYPGQCWVTSLEPEPCLSTGDGGAMFHVEHGQGVQRIGG